MRSGLDSCPSQTQNHRHDGRFNPPGEFGAICVVVERATALRELARQAALLGFAVDELLPRTMLRLRLHVRRVLDLRDESVCHAWGMTGSDMSQVSPALPAGAATKRSAFAPPRGVASVSLCSRIGYARAHRWKLTMRPPSRPLLSDERKPSRSAGFSHPATRASNCTGSSEQLRSSAPARA